MVQWLEAQAQREEVARPIRERMRQEAARAPVRVSQMIALIAERLFDSELSVKSVALACGIRDKSISTHFGRQLGCTPRPYIREARLETAAALLRTTQLPIFVIAELVCYGDLSSFGHAFERWDGQSPTAYRQQATEHAPGQEQVSDPPLSVATLRRVLNGSAAPDVVRKVLCRVQSLYAGRLDPRVDLAGSGEPEIVDGRNFERVSAAIEWETLRQRSPQEQIVRVRDRLRFPSAALCNLLLTKSREQGRTDRAEGVRLVELALHHLEGSAALLGDRLPDVRARALAHLGNAHRLALDFAAAEQAFADAKAEWYMPREHPDQTVLAESLALLSALRVFQRRLDEGLQLINEAITCFKAVEVPELLARSLIRRALIHDLQADYQAAVLDLRVAAALLEEGQDPYQDLVIAKNLATSYSLAGKYDKAEAALARARQCCKRSQNPVDWVQLTWIKGLIHEGRHQLDQAAGCYSGARLGFIARQEWGHDAAVSLYLAGVLVKQDKMEEALPVIAETLPLLDSLGLHPMLSKHAAYSGKPWSLKR